MTSNYTPRPWPKEDEEIFHYTDMNGLVGILSNSSIRMTNILYLNDWMEGKYIYDELIRELIKNDNSLSQIGEIYKKCLGNTYVVCFSGSANLLSQWKYYGNACLVFDRPTIDDNKEIIYGKQNYKECVYYDEDNLEKLKRTLQKAVNLVDVARGDQNSVLGFFCFLGLIKHIGFKEENERRLVHYFHTPHNKELQYRISNNKIIPYIELKIKPDSLKSIIIGPGKDQELTESAISQVLAKHSEYNHLKIFRSDIPFIPSK